MNKPSFDRLYRNVPREQKEELLHFRSTHPVKHLNVDGFDWEYIACGQGAQTLVILSGGLRTGEAAFHLILALENDYRIDYLMNYTFRPDDLDGWTGKMLIVESDDDLTIGLEQLKALKEMYPRAQVYTFHGAGHAPALTREVKYV